MVFGGGMVKGPSSIDSTKYSPENRQNAVSQPYTPSLRPYPIDPKQDKIVSFVSKLAGGVFAFRDSISKMLSTCFAPIKYVISKFSLAITPLTEVESRPELPIVFDSTQNKAMDSKFYYAIHDGKIFYKPIAADEGAPWKVFGTNDGYVDDKKTPLVAISADGDNVVAIDKDHHVHYAKSHFVNVELTDDSTDWEATTGSKVIWTTKWFNMTLVAPIVNRCKDPTLSVDKARSFGISHKGFDTVYYTDMAGKKHPDSAIGVTTLYLLSEDGTQYFFADPWLHNKFDNEITGPEDGQFVAESMAVSASTLFVIQRARDENGNECNKMYTRYADFDSIGSNPALPATYDIDNKTPLVRYLPAEDWTEQPEIKLEGEAKLTKEIFIIQTGRGQNHRQLRVIGTNSQGESGYYYKDIYEGEWRFEKVAHKIAPEAFLADTVAHTGFQQGKKVVHDYSGKIASSLADPPKVRLTKFAERGLNERGLHTKVELTLKNGKKLEFPVHARRGFRHLLGFDGCSKRLYWTLVIPKEYKESEDPEIKKLVKVLFNNKKVMKIHVKEHDSGVHISPVFFSGNIFAMDFEREKE